MPSSASGDDDEHLTAIQRMARDESVQLELDRLEQQHVDEELQVFRAPGDHPLEA